MVLICLGDYGKMKKLLHIYLLGLSFIKYVATQTYCSCTPLIYHWKLDFSGSCPPLQVPVGDGYGIANAFCKVTGSSSDDLIPVSVTAYTIIELDDELTPLKIQSEKDVSLVDGSMIRFSSLTAAEPNIYTGGLQVEISAVNSIEEPIRLVWILAFSNSCETLPFLSGDVLGWLSYDDSSLDPRPESCLVNSNAPSSEPSEFDSSNFYNDFSLSYSYSFSYSYEWDLAFEELDQYLLEEENGEFVY